jgi:hypothetical protein
MDAQSPAERSLYNLAAPERQGWRFRSRIRCGLKMRASCRTALTWKIIGFGYRYVAHYINPHNKCYLHPLTLYRCTETTIQTFRSRLTTAFEYVPASVLEYLHISYFLWFLSLLANSPVIFRSAAARALCWWFLITIDAVYYYAISYLRFKMLAIRLGTTVLDITI